jgi:hypothetical protein
VPFEDFEAVGLDPEGGFDDEEVTLMLPELATAFEMMPARIARTGVIFNVVESGTGLQVRAGDRVTLRIHSKEAAAGPVLRHQFRGVEQWRAGSCEPTKC